VAGIMFAAMWITETGMFIVNGIFLGGLSLYRASCHQHHRHLLLWRYTTPEPAPCAPSRLRQAT
jgi:hypothetical protein